MIFFAWDCAFKRPLLCIRPFAARCSYIQQNSVVLSHYCTSSTSGGNTHFPNICHPSITSNSPLLSFNPLSHEINMYILFTLHWFYGKEHVIKLLLLFHCLLHNSYITSCENFCKNQDLPLSIADNFLCAHDLYGSPIVIQL